MKKLNIAIFTDTFIPQRDGVVTSTLSLAKGLADKGNKICIIAPNYKNFKELLYPNISVKRMPGIPALFYPGFKLTSPISVELIRYLKDKKIDVIHFQTPFTLGAQAVLIAKILRKPLIGTFHTFITDEQYIRHIGINSSLIKKISWSYVRNYYNKCNLITCPSESTKKELVENGFIRPVRVISNGIDLFSSDNSKWKKIKEKYKLNASTLLFIGRIAHEKNLDYLLECFKLVVKKVPNTKLIIVGDGPQMDQLKKYANKLGISNNIIFTGKIEHEELLKSGIFKAVDLFVTASTTENQPMTILEAQINGLACVGINARGIKDLIKDGYNGYLAKNGDKEDFAEKIVSLIKNKKLLEKMSKNTLKEIKKHEIKSVISQWEETYNEVINERK